MMIISTPEFNYLMANGKMFKYLRFYNRFSREDEPIMIIDASGKRRVGTCKTTLQCILQGKTSIESLERFVKDTPYKDSKEWMEEINKLYVNSNLMNGYVFLLELNIVKISPVKMHTSCNNCIKVNICGEYINLKDPLYCENKVSDIDVDNPQIVIKRYRGNLYEVLKELDKLRDIKDRTDIIIGVTGLMEDLRRMINV